MLIIQPTHLRSLIYTFLEYRHSSARYTKFRKLFSRLGRKGLGLGLGTSKATTGGFGTGRAQSRHRGLEAREDTMEEWEEAQVLPIASVNRSWDVFQNWETQHSEVQGNQEWSTLFTGWTNRTSSDNCLGPAAKKPPADCSCSVLTKAQQTQRKTCGGPPNISSGQGFLQNC